LSIYSSCEIDMAAPAQKEAEVFRAYSKQAAVSNILK
jgi:hypothetical protein